MKLILLVVAAWLLPTAPLIAQRHTFPTQYDDHFRKYTKRYFGVGFDWKVFKAQALAESNLTPDVSSRVGAFGLMQLMPSTFQEIQTKNPEFERIDDPQWNIAAGICYNRKLWLKFSDQNSTGEHLHFTFGSYNAGPTRIFKAQTVADEDSLDSHVWQNVAVVAPKIPNWRYRETLTYVQKIDSLHSLLLDPKER